MPTTLRNTDILFNDGSTQGTAFNATAVLNATAGASVGAVGTYVLAWASNYVQYLPGATIAGGTLRYTNAAQAASQAGISGTWRCMGRVDGGVYAGQQTTVWLRIS